MSTDGKGIPYFDELLKLVGTDEEMRRAFGKDVHWGYWKDPGTADGGVDDFVVAAEALTRKTISQVPLKDGMRILDVGCGFGGTIELLNEEVSNCHLVGVNIEERQLERARSRVKAKNGNTVEFIRMNANDLDFEESFGAIFAVECIFHFKRPRFFKHIKRLLEPGARFVMTDFIVKPWMSPIFRVLNGLTRGHTLATYGDIDLSYSLSRYREVAGKAGLVVSRDIDISVNTIPTYEFVLRQIAKVECADRSKRFRKATVGLDKATRWGILGYHVVGFEHSPD